MKQRVCRGTDTDAAGALRFYEQVLEGANTLELEAWIKTDGLAADGNGVLVGEGWNGSTWLILQKSSYGHRFYSSVTTVNGSVEIISDPIDISNVYHIKSVYDGAYFSLYINDVRVNKKAITGSVHSDTSWFGIMGQVREGGATSKYLNNTQIWGVKVKKDGNLIIDMPLQGNTYNYVPGGIQLNNGLFKWDTRDDLVLSPHMDYAVTKEINPIAGKSYVDGAWSAMTDYDVNNIAGQSLTWTYTGTDPIYTTTYYNTVINQQQGTKARLKIKYKTSAGFTSVVVRVASYIEDVYNGTGMLAHLQSSTDEKETEIIFTIPSKLASSSIGFQFNKVPQNEWFQLIDMEMIALDAPVGNTLYETDYIVESGYWNNESVYNYLRLSNSIWDKSNPAVWDSSIQSLITYDSDHPRDWRLDELNKDFLAKYAKDAYRLKAVNHPGEYEGAYVTFGPTLSDVEEYTLTFIAKFTKYSSNILRDRGAVQYVGMYTLDDGRIYCRVGTGSSLDQVSADIPDFDKEHEYKFERTGGILYLYIDGVLKDSIAAAKITDTSNTFLVGANKYFTEDLTLRDVKLVADGTVKIDMNFNNNATNAGTEAITSSGNLVYERFFSVNNIFEADNKFEYDTPLHKTGDTYDYADNGELLIQQRNLLGYTLPQKDPNLRKVINYLTHKGATDV